VKVNVLLSLKLFYDAVQLHILYNVTRDRLKLMTSKERFRKRRGSLFDGVIPDIRGESE